MNWKKIMAVGLAAVSMMAFVSGCGSDTKTTNELPKKIVVGLDDSFPPMGFKDDKGEIVGFDIDLAKEAAKRAGMDVEFKAIDWSSKEAELKSKKIDVLWNGLTVTPEREKNILFSNVYMNDKEYVIVRADDDSVKGKADLAGKIVGVQQASSGEKALAEDPSGKTVKETKSYADFVSAFMDLGIGRLDAVIADGVVARYLMTKDPGKYKIVEGVDYGGNNFAIGFRKDDTALRDKINGILVEMKKDGTADKIADKWFGTGADLDKSDAK
ncbi:amino acid ABC transporter substrate-binding protein [Veillonella sp.]